MEEQEGRAMRSVKECLKIGCWTVIKSFHVKIILLDKQELIQEIQVCRVLVMHRLANIGLGDK